MSPARRDLEYLRGILATGVFGTGDVSWAVAAVCDHLEVMLEKNVITEADYCPVTGDPTDSEVPVTEEWLRAVGAEEDRKCDLWIGPAMWFEFPAGGEFLIDHHKGEFRLRTRGDVRLLCRALRLTLKESA